MSIEKETKIIIQGSHGIRPLRKDEHNYEMRLRLTARDRFRPRQVASVEVMQNGCVTGEHFASLGELVQFLIDELAE